MTLRTIRFKTLSVLWRPLRDFISARVRRTIQNTVSLNLNYAEMEERRCTHDEALADSLQSMPGNGWDVLRRGKYLSAEKVISGLF
jgi:hypothetical protein